MLSPKKKPNLKKIKTSATPNQTKKTKQTTAITYFQQSHSLNKQQKTHATKSIITSDTKQNQIFNYLQCCVYFI